MKYILLKSQEESETCEKHNERKWKTWKEGKAELEPQLNSSFHLGKFLTKWSVPEAQPQ